MTILHMVFLFLVSVVGGALNSVAGGGSFFVFPALIFTGVPPIPANATCTIALWPGSVASVGAYRHELKDLSRVLVILLISSSVIGGLGGAILLLHTPQTLFVHLLPYLLLIATLLFTFSGSVTRWLRVDKVNKKSHSVFTLIGISIAQLVIAAYGGYFGGGIGILMLAVLALVGMDQIHAMNALKTVLASCINGVAVVAFILAGAIYWPQALLMIVGAILGGYGGAYYAHHVPPQWIRALVMVIGFSLTIYFFIWQ